MITLSDLETRVLDAIRRVAVANSYKEVDPDKLELIKRVYTGFENATDEPVELKLYPEFDTLGLSVNLPEVELRNLISILLECTSFEVIPRTDGKLRVSVGVSHIY